jgi:predicted enzyme related to lactoylglutathione lyase
MVNSFLGLRTCIYRVSDIQQGKQWYTKAFGMEPYFDEPFYVGFNIAGYELGLQPEEPTTVKGESVFTYWGVKDVSEEYKRLLEMGASAFEAPAEVGGGIIVAAVKDPWNNVLGIIFNPHFKLG